MLDMGTFLIGKQSCEHLFFWIVFVSCVIAGPLNAVFFKMLYISYGARYSFFVCQMINVIYVVQGAVALHFVRDEITDEMRAISHTKYVAMGLLDFIGGFMCSLGAYYTSGSKQQLFNQAVIPITMLFSWLLLGRRSSVAQVFGAFVVLVGAAVVIFPSFLSTGISDPSDGDAPTGSFSVVLVSEVLYLFSNVPMALSYVYKEYGFKNLAVHVMYLTQMVSIYQMLFGFLLVPLQALVPGAPSVSGTVRDLYGGWLCFLKIDRDSSSSYLYPDLDQTSCIGSDPFWLMLGYCTVNFVFNTLGLYVVKFGSATLNSISYAIILPLTILAFTLPILGPYQEACGSSTKYGLAITLVGFFIWRLGTASSEHVEEEAEKEESDIGDVGGGMAYIEIPAASTGNFATVAGPSGSGTSNVSGDSVSTSGSRHMDLRRLEQGRALADEESPLLAGSGLESQPGPVSSYNSSLSKQSHKYHKDFVPDSFHERVICGFN